MLTGPGLIVAHVDEAFRAHPSVGLKRVHGRDVTVLLAGGAPALGDKVLFFAKDWLYGAQIALREVARQKATAEIEKAVVEAVERLPIRLEAGLDGAVVVVAISLRMRPRLRAECF